MNALVKTELQARLRARIRQEWLWTISALLAFTFCLSFFSEPLLVRRLDHTLYDSLLNTLTRNPPSPDIVLITIDDSSIAELGFWPWRRTRHAQILQPLHQARAVALDLLLSEVNPAYPDDDHVLAAAIESHGRVVLPLMIDDDRNRLTLPTPTLAAATPYLGHINIYPDADGVVRSVRSYIRLADGQRFPHITLAMLAAAGNSSHRAIPPADAGHETRTRHSKYIPYAGKPGSFIMYPYHRVLHGDIPPDAFKDKFVLVGSWGSGLGDTFPTPLTREGSAMAGVEILANILNSQLQDRWIAQPDRLIIALLSMLPVLLCSLSFRRLSPQHAFLVTALGLLITFGISALILHFLLWWLSPVAALIGVTLAYPVWSWRSQHAALRHIEEELDLLQMEQTVTASTGPTPARGPQDSTPSGVRPVPEAIARWLTPLSEARRAYGRAASDEPVVPRRQLQRSLPARLGQLHDAIEQMRRAQRHRNETLRFLSHDMRAPLNSILALTQLQRVQQQTSESVPAPSMLANYDRYARKTLALVDGFVALSRAEVIDLDLRPVSLTDVLMQCCEDLWVQAQQKNISIDYDGLPGDAWVQADSDLLERALSNLLDNAVKYSKPGTRVSCRLERHKDSWRVIIQDQGRGMSADALNTLFKPFARFDDDEGTNPSGVGLGMAFVQTVVHRHDGRIKVLSTPGAGTRVTIDFPLIPAPD